MMVPHLSVCPCVYVCVCADSPIRQWMYYDAAEALPDKPLEKADVQPVGCRYDGSIMVFGKAMQVGCRVYLMRRMGRFIVCAIWEYYG